MNKWKVSVSAAKEGRRSVSGCAALKAQWGQTRRQKQRPRQSQQLPDHMIADRCQGAAEGGCMQITQSTGQSKNVKSERGDRKTTRGCGMGKKHETFRWQKNSVGKNKEKEREEKKRTGSTVSVEAARWIRSRLCSGTTRLKYSNAEMMLMYCMFRMRFTVDKKKTCVHSKRT